MKKNELRGLIEEHMVLSKRIEHLKEELKKTEDRYKKVGEFLYPVSVHRSSFSRYFRVLWSE
jgi:hypothetical protein